MHAEDISVILKTKDKLSAQTNSQSYNPYYMFLSKVKDEFNRLDEESRNTLISIPPELWVYLARTRKTLKRIPWEELSPHLMKTDEERPRIAIVGSVNLVQNLYESFERYYYIDKKYFSALRICDELINMEPQNPGYYNWRALPLLALGEFERAIEDYRKAFEIARLPLYIINEPHTHYQFAAIDSSNKERHLLDAIECYKAAIAIEPLSAIQMNYWIAESYNQLGDLQSSSKYYGEILKSNPNNTLALNGLGRIHLAKKEYAEAISKFNEILQGEISNIEKSSAYLNLATVYDNMFYDKGMDSKNITTAKKYLKIANELDPQNVEIVRYLEKLNQTFPYA